MQKNVRFLTFTFIIIVLFFAIAEADAAMYTIVRLADHITIYVDPDNSDHIFVKLRILEKDYIAVESKDKGETFIIAEISSIPDYYTDGEKSDKLKYVIDYSTEGSIKRSSDGGQNWETTNLRNFADQIINDRKRKKHLDYISKYGDFFKNRYLYWTTYYIFLSILYLGISAYSLSKKSLKLSSLFASGLLLSVIWLLLTSVSRSMEILFDFETVPSQYFRILMNISTRPLYLIVTFIPITIFLPTTKVIYSQKTNSAASGRNLFLCTWKILTVLWWMIFLFSCFILPIVYIF